MRKKDELVLQVQAWFRDSVTYQGEPYVIDYEQAVAVADESLNTIVVARAGSGKTRTLVAKIVYLVAKCKVTQDEIMAFVFNANAAREINERLGKMRVDGEAVIGDGALSDGTAGTGVKIASTFHAFSRKIVYKVCKGEKKCGKILAGEKEDFMLLVVREMMSEAVWGERIWGFMRGDFSEETVKAKLSDEEIVGFARMMASFINRAQQKYLGGEESLAECAKRYLGRDEISERERLFVELGVECFRRYHWYLLDEKARLKLCARWNEPRFMEYGTDFNLIVSWASKLIRGGRKEVRGLLAGKKYILIDEYQDFSQLFLAAVEAIRGVASGARLFVVGDDWQAINRFAGSDVGYFKGFEKYFGDGVRRVEITTNYRCDREVVGRARKFMIKAMREKGEFRAFSKKIGEVVVVNPRDVSCELPVVEWDKRVGSDDVVYKEMARRAIGREPKKKTVRYMKAILELIRKNSGMKDYLLLHRNNETNLEGMSLTGLAAGLKWGLVRLEVMSVEEFDAKVQVMTMHKSKGLEAEMVIILEADEGVIPKVHPDTILYGVFGETSKVVLDDQKRLFYVAMTRAKKRLYIMSEGGGFVKYLGRGVERWGE